MRCKQGDTAKIIRSVDGLMVGKTVKVELFRGYHSQHGGIWNVRSVDGDLVTEYGARGPCADVPDEWLEPLPPEPPKAANDGQYTPRELEKA